MLENSHLLRCTETTAITTFNMQQDLFEDSDDDYSKEFIVPQQTAAKPKKVNPFRLSEQDSDFDVNDDIFSDDDELVEPLQSLQISEKTNRIMSEGGVPNLKFQCLTTDDVYKQMLERVRRIKPVMSLPTDDIILLMQKYNWNEEKLLEAWTDDRESVISDVGLRANANPFRDKRLQEKKDFMCPICCEEKNTSTFSLECKHEFCLDCYKRYLEDKLHSGNIINCMGCSLALKNKDIDIIMGHKSSTKLIDSSIRSFLQKHSQTYKWCPFTDCEHIIYFDHLTDLSEYRRLHCSPYVTCRNSHKFCFSCGFEAHSPADCDLTNAWVKKTRKESDYLNWVLSNTKECPKCNVNIEKNGGCNHMKCSSCEYEFCWICNGPWAPHGTSYYECTRYKEEKEKDQKVENEEERKKKKFTFYYRIFNEHEISARLDWKLGQTVTQSIHHLQEKTGLSWIEGQYLTDSLKVLNEGRTALKWSFAVIYYSDQSHNLTKIFVDNQALLAAAVESLSEMLSEKNSKVLMSKKTEFFDKSGYVVNRKHALLECGRDLLCKGICKPH